ncbi:MAG: class I SAM-dependent DNA methyltransferase [Oricola sp.]
MLEAKQSVKRGKKRPDPDQLHLLPEDALQQKSGHAKQGTKQWDQVMLAARKQAEEYARALPVEHGYPPFLLIADIGNVIEVYADFSGQGKNYAHFPDRRSYRIAMDDLRDPDIQARLRAIWTDPHSLDPAKRSAEVTRDIAERLAIIAKRLEGKHDPKDVAEFLMRCLFTMFAEDVELLPKHSFEDLLEGLKDKPDAFVPALESLWKVMDEGGYEPRMMTALKRFNGSLFKTRKALPLDAEGIHELRVAASRDWSDVEPAIFGTLLERALDPRERSKLGAHYTPRAYVERLVVPTIIEPLRAEWETVQSAVQEKLAAKKFNDARRLVDDFHHKLCTIRVLDPACGTGNFLYVSLELLKKLEGETLEALENIEGDVGLSFQGETVNPSQFYGLEINPRAVAIADLVLWIGFIKWQLKTSGLNAISEPILHAYGTIREQDAILAWDRKVLRRDEHGRPIRRWDGVTRKPHPITGEAVPDPDATVEIYDYVNPRPADWPEAEFIVGNPPFIGGKDMRAELGDGYAEACWKVRPHMPGGADFVMHFWDEAARRLARKDTAKQPNPLRRFGFITTNSITQTFSRRVIEKHLSAKEPISLVFAVPDHPWMKAADKAAVRIAMTVAEKGEHEGVLAEVVREDGLNSDTPRVDLDKREGKITAKLTVGADLALAKPILSNESLAYRGVQTIGSGFIVTPQQAATLGLGKIPELEKYILDYRNGRDIAQRPRGVMVIDLFGLTTEEVRQRFPAVYQHLLATVKPERDQNNRKSYRENWWIFGEPRGDMRPVLEPLSRYITTIETAKHRFFQFLDASVRPDNMLVNIGLDRPEALACLSSRLHVNWAISAGGWLGVGNDPRYSKSRTFDPFPFPACVTDDSNPALKQRLADLGEKLDAFRKERLAKHDFLTMTAMYNVLERMRELENGCDVDPLSDSERAIYEAGLIAVLKDIHDAIDRAVFEAYGWRELGERLVGKPGATMPSPHKTGDQEAAEEELLTRLVTLNLERQAEERRGKVRWLRPDYQIARLGHKVSTAEEQIEADIGIVAAAAEKPKWPKEPFEQIRIVKDVLAKASAPATPDEVASAFGGRTSAKRRERVGEVLRLLAETGGARTGEMDGEARYFVAR